MTTINNELLVHRAKAKDPDAFSELIRRYTADMYRVAYAILMNNEDAADAMQDAILACWEKIGKLKETAYFKTWLTKILINKCHDIRKHRKRELATDEREDEPTEDVYNLEFEEALQTLDEKYRIIIVLYYSEGYSMREIGKLLHLPTNTVSTRLRRGRERLKDYYQMGGKCHERQSV